MLEFYFRFQFLCLRHHRHVILHLPTKFRPNRTIISDGVMTSYPFLRWRPRHRYSTSGFGFRNFAHLGRSTSTCIPNFGDISQSTAEILLLPVSDNKRPPCWNSTSGFNFYVCVTIGISFCICVPNFVQIRPSATELWCHIHFSRWRPSAILNYLNVTADHPQSANGVSGRSSNFDDRIYSFGDNAIFVMRLS